MNLLQGITCFKSNLKFYECCCFQDLTLPDLVNKYNNVLLV